MTKSAHRDTFVLVRRRSFGLLCDPKVRTTKSVDVLANDGGPRQAGALQESFRVVTHHFYQLPHKSPFCVLDCTEKN
jgi:hypothetical protein